MMPTIGVVLVRHQKETARSFRTRLLPPPPPKRQGIAVSVQQRSLSVRSRKIETECDQRSMPALALKASQILHRGTVGFADNLSEARLVNSVSSRGLNTTADSFQALDQSEHRHRFCRFRHLAHPGKPALASFRTTLRQHVQLAPLFGG